jgi:hypothetical protein
MATQNPFNNQVLDANVIFNGGTMNIGSDATDNAINVGTNANAGRTVTVGNAVAASTTNVNCGTGGANFGTSANAHTTTVGSTNGASATTVQSGSGALNVTATGGALTINSGVGALSISNDASATTVNIASGGAAKVVQLGSTNGASSLALKCGTIGFTLASASGNIISATSLGVITLLNDLDVTEGGTGVSTLTSHGILFGNGAGDIQATAEPSDGQLLIGSTGNAPVLSSLTAGAGISITPGAGTIAIAISGQVFFKSTTILTSAEIKLLHANPIVVIPAQGAGTFISIINVVTKLNYGGSNVFVAGASQFLSLWYDNYVTGWRPFNAIVNAQIVAANSSYSLTSPLFITGLAAASENKAIIIANNNATEISGNASNDNTITIEITYCVLTI